MSDELIAAIVTNIPNFAGFIMLGYLQWRTIQALLALIDKMSDED